MLEIETYISNELVKCNCNEFQIKQLIDLIHPLLVKPNDIDTNKLKCWLAERNLTFKDNPIAWLKKVLVEELQKGTFEKEIHHCCIHPFLVVLGEHGIKVEKNADCYLSTMFDYLINNGIITQEQLVDFNQKALKYLANQDKTTSDFINLWKQSKVSKEKNINWNEIDTLADQQLKKHIELLKELEK